LTLAVLLAICCLVQGQFKTSGIKTRQPPSGNLQLAGNSSEFTQSGFEWSSYNESNYGWNSQNQSNYAWNNQNYVGQESRGYVPAETYQPPTLPPLYGRYVHFSWNYPKAMNFVYERQVIEAINGSESKPSLRLPH